MSPNVSMSTTNLSSRFSRNGLLLVIVTTIWSIPILPLAEAFSRAWTCQWHNHKAFSYRHDTFDQGFRTIHHRMLPSPSVSSVADIDESPSIPRAKVNEIDFCIAPADATLSSKSTASLTRYLNNASNRAVRRILLARSWPSAEALNRSFRQVLLSSSSTASSLNDDSTKSSPIDESSITTTTTAKCPVPRPILNILMRQQSPKAETIPSGDTIVTPRPRSRSDEEYVLDQMRQFRMTYADAPGCDLAEAYLECILSLATSGIESERYQEVKSSGVYHESYRRVLSVLQSVGVVWDVLDDGRRKIAPKLLDQDICLSVLDKIQIEQEGNNSNIVATKTNRNPSQNTLATQAESIQKVEEKVVGSDLNKGSTIRQSRMQFWRRSENESGESELETKTLKLENDEMEEEEMSEEDLGGVLLSSKEPSMTRQLNALSNIVLRALLFGGDEELLVLSETLDADKPAFILRWYPSDRASNQAAGSQSSDSDESRPGVQYLNCLIRLLQICYANGKSNLDPPLQLTSSYKVVYERLTAMLVELGSGYIQPEYPNVVPIPRTAREELGRFAVWETNLRQDSRDVVSNVKNSINTHPEDMTGTWEVCDAVGGQTIGVSRIKFLPQGDVQAESPYYRGLRWRLDPGPTHLDTCTFQVLSEDGAVLQYRGFIDRGARLEARFSKRPIRIRGSVMFQMRVETDANSWKTDMLPMTFKTDTTKFVMTKQIS